MPALHGIGLTFSAATVTYAAGAVDGVRVDAGTEAITLPAGGKFRKSLLTVDEASGAVTETAGTDADTLVLAAYPAVPAGEIVLCGVELDDTAITDLDLTLAGNKTAVSG